MEIRLTELQDIPAVMQILDAARRFMASTGNPNQWIDGYPSREVIVEDIRQGHSYVCADETGEIVGTFCFKQNAEDNYREIYDGEWLNDDAYGVIHRLASGGRTKGIASLCFDWCFSRCPNLRADTHRDNAVMQHILIKNGFVKCGTIFVENGTPRIAFQKLS